MRIHLSALRASGARVCQSPRPHGRGYTLMALRAYLLTDDATSDFPSLFIREWSRRTVLPLGEHIAIAIRHFDFGQSLRVEDLVFRDDTVFVEQKGRDRVDLIR